MAQTKETQRSQLALRYFVGLCGPVVDLVTCIFYPLCKYKVGVLNIFSRQFLRPTNTQHSNIVNVLRSKDLQLNIAKINRLALALKRDVSGR